MLKCVRPLVITHFECPCPNVGVLFSNYNESNVPRMCRENKDTCSRLFRPYIFMFRSKVFFSKEDMHYSLNTVHRQYITGVSDSGLVVLMSGHFASQCCCHLTSLLFYKKGHSMHSDTKTHICTLHCWLQLHIPGCSHAHSEPTLCTEHMHTSLVLVTECTPCCHISHPPTHAAGFTRNKWHYAVCTPQTSILMVRAVLLILIINEDSANYYVLSDRGVVFSYWHVGYMAEKCFSGLFVF